MLNFIFNILSNSKKIINVIYINIYVYVGKVGKVGVEVGILKNVMFLIIMIKWE